MNLNLNMYTATIVQRTPEGIGYILSPNYTPKKSTFQSQLNSDSKPSAGNTVTANNNITEEQKKKWSTEFAGKKEFSIEEWDDFLLDLEDSGILTRGERWECLGLLIPIGNEKDLIGLKSGKSVEVYGCYSNMEDLYPLSKWNGNPLEWLQDMDLYYYKQELSAKMDGRNPDCFQRVRKNCNKIADILKEFLV